MIEMTRPKPSELRRLRLQAQALAAEARYRALFDGISDAILVCDGSGRYVDANLAAVALLGYTRDELLRRDREEVVAGAPVPVPAELAELGRDGSGHRELELTRPNGAVVLVEARATAVPLPTGHAYVAVLRDLTERRQAEREREQLRQDWTTVVAHDLRQPLTVITGYANLLRNHLGEGDGADPANRAVEHISSAAHNLKRMIEDLLDLSRIETNRLQLRRQGVDLSDLILTVLERSSELAEEHPVEADVPRTVGSIEVDPERVEQVLGNLLSNAAKYGYPRSPIQVALRRLDNEVAVSLTNYGVGIPADEIPNLFTRFNRLDEATHRQIPGLGLGLYIAKGLVEAHGGTIWVESIPDEVTTFHFTLPIAGPDALLPQR